MSAASEKLAALVTEFGEDDDKFEKGNNTAGTRARNKLMEIRKACIARKEEMMAKVHAESGQ